MFECTKCGLCCKNVKHLEHLLGFAVSEDGVCSKFDRVNNLCTVYSQRPLICRIDDGYELFKDQFSLVEWYQLNQKACQELQNAGRINSSFSEKASIA